MTAWCSGLLWSNHRGQEDGAPQPWAEGYWEQGPRPGSLHIQAATAGGLLLAAFFRTPSATLSQKREKKKKMKYSICPGGFSFFLPVLFSLYLFSLYSCRFTQTRFSVQEC